MPKAAVKARKQGSAPHRKLKVDGEEEADLTLRLAFFPFARYTSVVGVHTTLLGFAALFLPRTTFLSEWTRPNPDQAILTSRDKPQHPFLDPLTLSPRSTLVCVCLGAALLQAWWAGWVRIWLIEFKLEGVYHEEKTIDRHLEEKKRWTSIRNAWAATFVASVVFHMVLVLFGAPLASHIPQTYLLALLLSLLTVFAPAYTLSPPTVGSDTQSVVNRMTWTRLFAEFSIRNPIERAMVYPAIGTLVGCWLGAIPIALDWDRPWQAWPLTSAFAAILGYILASMGALTVSAIHYLAEEHLRNARSAKKE